MSCLNLLCFVHRTQPSRPSQCYQGVKGDTTVAEWLKSGAAVRERHGEVPVFPWRDLKASWERSGKALEIWGFFVQMTFFSETSSFIFRDPNCQWFRMDLKATLQKGLVILGPWLVDLASNLCGLGAIFTRISVENLWFQILGTFWSQVSFSATWSTLSNRASSGAYPNRRICITVAEFHNPTSPGRWISKMCPSNRWTLGRSSPLDEAGQETSGLSYNILYCRYCRYIWLYMYIWIYIYIWHTNISYYRHNTHTQYIYIYI